MYLKIQSKGEMQIEALSLMGASSKRGDGSKIGMFGTGNKYALAYLIRNNYKLRIFVGDQEVEISTKEINLREAAFQQIFINGRETSLTTSLGKDWQLPMAIREIYSNAVDEGLLFFDTFQSDPSGEADTTTFYITMNDHLSGYFLNVEDYLIINQKPLFENQTGGIYPKTRNPAIFRRGIKCSDTPGNQMFNYSLNKIALNEEREAKYNFEVMEGVWKLLYQCDNEMIIRSVLNSEMKNFYEIGIDGSFVSTYSNLISEKWKEILNEKMLAPEMYREFIKDNEIPNTYILPNKLYFDATAVMEDYRKPTALEQSSDGRTYKNVILTENDQQVLNDAIKFLEERSFSIPYEIKAVDFVEKRIMGAAHDNMILIGIRNFSEGVHYTVNTIIEEYIHIKHGVRDETREFQTAAINELVSYMARVKK